MAFSCVNDLSSCSLDPVGPGAAWKLPLDRERESTRDLRPPSSLGGGWLRFLKKAPPPATTNSQSPVRKSKTLQSESRHVSSSQRGSQTAALSRLAEIENRIRSQKQGQQPLADQSVDVSVQLSAQSNSEQSLQGKRFLKRNTAVVANIGTCVAVGSPKAPDCGGRLRSKAADALVLSGLSIQVTQGVSLDSDEEDMKKLLGNSLDSVETSFFKPGKPPSKTSTDKDQISQKVHFTSPPAAISRSSTSSGAPPASPPCHESPFRFTGQAQAHFSPSVLSSSPSPSCVSSSSPPGRPNFPHRAGSLQRSLSSMSGRSEPVSLDELFPVEDSHSRMSAVSSEDFKINVMTLDDLVPANLGSTKKAAGEERTLKEKVNKEEQPQLEEEDVLDYQSDFESQSRKRAEHSASQVSEHLQGHGDEVEEVSEVSEKVSDSDVSNGRTEDYSSTFSDMSFCFTSPISDHRDTLSRSRKSRSLVSDGNRTLSCQSRRRAIATKDLKEAAVQTQPDPQVNTWPSGMGMLGPEVDMAHMYPTPAITHTLSAEMVEALSTFNPAMFALNEMLKQQLAMTKLFIERSQQLHSNLVQSLGPPNYRYTTLQDTKEYIRKGMPPKLTLEETLQEHLL